MNVKQGCAETAMHTHLTCKHTAFLVHSPVCCYYVLHIIFTENQPHLLLYCPFIASLFVHYLLYLFYFWFISIAKQHGALDLSEVAKKKKIQLTS